MLNGDSDWTFVDYLKLSLGLVVLGGVSLWAYGRIKRGVFGRKQVAAAGRWRTQDPEDVIDETGSDFYAVEPEPEPEPEPQPRWSTPDPDTDVDVSESRPKRVSRKRRSAEV
jgi:hypothetical protein